MTKLLYLLVLLPFAATANEPMPKHPKQAQYQDQHQKQAQSQSQANAQSVNFEDRYQAPASFAPAIASTAPCYYGKSGALSVPGGSIGGGKAVLDAACEKREDDRLSIEKARAFMLLGRNDIALSILCQNMECPAEPVKSVAVSTDSQFVTKDELKKALEATVRK